MRKLKEKLTPAQVRANYAYTSKMWEEIAKLAMVLARQYKQKSK